jgi:glycosyltransferase involved in cell wall biosynthesis
MRFRNGEKNLIFLGRLTKVKRLDLLLKAVARLREASFLCNVTFIGEGEDRSTLEALALQLGVEDVWFTGETYDDSVLATLIYHADLCVSPGNVGLTAIHCLTFGTPVVTHGDSSHQMPEFEAIHPGATGAFFKNGDPENLALVIGAWFAQGLDREEVRQACYDVVSRRWTPTYQLAQIESALELSTESCSVPGV